MVKWRRERWELDIGRASSTVFILARSRPVWSAAFTSDGTRIITANWDYTARAWGRCEWQAALAAAAASGRGAGHKIKAIAQVISTYVVAARSTSRRPSARRSSMLNWRKKLRPIRPSMPKPSGRSKTCTRKSETANPNAQNLDMRNR